MGEIMCDDGRYYSPEFGDCIDETQQVNHELRIRGTDMRALYKAFDDVERAKLPPRPLPKPVPLAEIIQFPVPEPIIESEPVFDNVIQMPGVA
jgi:hypothetical protein